MAEQLTFELPVRTALGRDDYFVSDSNSHAVRAIENWGDWPQDKMLLIGRRGAGKTHLAYVWAAMADAEIISAQTIPSLEIANVASCNIVVEDIDKIAGDQEAEQALFHCHNLTLEKGHKLLMTAQSLPTPALYSLPDLASRLQGTAITALPRPDDALLAALMVKLFADRQLVVTPQIVNYLLGRMERSFEETQELVAELDRTALQKGSSINRTIALQVLDKLRQSGP